MKRLVLALCCLLAASGPLLVSGCRHVSPPPMPDVPNPVPGPEAGSLEVERYQLQEEKRVLGQNYGDNIDRIQQINTRLIEINMELQRQGRRP